MRRNLIDPPVPLVPVRVVVEAVGVTVLVAAVFLPVTVLETTAVVVGALAAANVVNDTVSIEVVVEGMPKKNV